MRNIDIRVATVAFLIFEGLMLLQATLAYFDQFLTVSQMHSKGLTHGMPFIWHFAMLGDIVIVSPLAAYTISRYGHLWSWLAIIKCVAIGFVGAAAMHWLYLQGTVPGVHIIDHRLTEAGIVHFLFMACALAVFTLFFFCTAEASVGSNLKTSALLLIHVFLGTHLALGLLKRYKDIPWYPPDPLHDLPAWLTFFGVGLVLLCRTTIRAKKSVASLLT